MEIIYKFADILVTAGGDERLGFALSSDRG